MPLAHNVAGCGLLLVDIARLALADDVREAPVAGGPVNHERPAHDRREQRRGASKAFKQHTPPDAAGARGLRCGFAAHRDAQLCCAAQRRANGSSHCALHAAASLDGEELSGARARRAESRDRTVQFIYSFNLGFRRF